MLDDDILKFSHRVDQRATALAEDMVRELRASRAAILGKLAALAADAGDNFDDLPLSRRKALLAAQAEAIDGVLADVYAKAGTSLIEAGKDVIGATMTATATIFRTRPCARTWRRWHGSRTTRSCRSCP